MSERWTAARTFIRRLAAARLSACLAEQLLPIDGAEDLGMELGDGATTGLLDADFTTLAARYPELLASEQRKRRGTWYTPPALATPTVDRALAPLVDRVQDPGLRICDPAAGGGTFLVAALRWLVQNGADPGRAATTLHGVDVDSTAAALAALAVHETAIELGADRDALDPRTIAANVRRGDGLLDLDGNPFDAVLTNPPWETLQADSYSRDHVARLRARFAHQGNGKLFTYRLFVERAHQLLRPGGRFGLIVPASLWFDRDAAPLRQLLLDECEWEWLFGFENRRRLFAIDSRYRFAVVIGRRGGHTTAVRCAFGRTDPADWAARSPASVRYPRTRLQGLSPRHATFVECEHVTDLELLARMQDRSMPLTGPGGAFEWRQGDFNMTSDRDRFVQRTIAEEQGYRRDDRDGVWRRPERRQDQQNSELLPLYQGAMLFDLHPNTGAHAGGTGHKTRWQPPRECNDLRPLYLVDAAAFRAGAGERGPARIALRALSNATNERTAAACLLPDVPCGNSLGVLTERTVTETPLLHLAAGAAVLGSLPFDWALRRRLTGTNLNGFVLTDCRFPRLSVATTRELARLALQLCAILPWHRALWQRAEREGWCCEGRESSAPLHDRRARGRALTAIDRLVGRAFGFERSAVAHIVHDAGPRGFARVDRDLPPEQRRPQRWLAEA